MKSESKDQVTHMDRFVFAVCEGLSIDSWVFSAEMLPQHILLQDFFATKGFEVLTPRGHSVLDTCKGAYHRRQPQHLISKLQT